MKYFYICLKVVPSFYIFCLFLWFRLLMSQIWLQFFNYSSNFIITSDYTFIILYKNYLALTYFSHFLNFSIALFTKFSKIPLKKEKNQFPLICLSYSTSGPNVSNLLLPLNIWMFLPFNYKINYGLFSASNQVVLSKRTSVFPLSFSH